MSNERVEKQLPISVTPSNDLAWNTSVCLPSQIGHCALKCLALFLNDLLPLKLPFNKLTPLMHG